MALLSSLNLISPPAAIATPFLQLTDTAQNWVVSGSATVTTISSPTSSIPLFPYRTQAIQVFASTSEYGEVPVSLPAAAAGPVTISFYARGDGVASWVFGMYLAGSGVSTITITPPTTGGLYQVALNLPAAGSYTFRALRNSSGPATCQINGLSIASQNYSAGRTDGATVPAGYVGEVYQTVINGGNLTTGTAGRAAIVTMPSAGTWLINISTFMGGTATSLTKAEVSISTTDAFTVTRSTTVSVGAWRGATIDISADSLGLSIPLGPLYVTSSSAPVVYVYAKATFSGGGNTLQQYGYVTAVRIA